MKRRHGRDDAIRFCEAIRRARPEMVFGADLIAGFPTETEAMFGNTLALVEECGLTWLHVFPYSARKGTPAARMPQVPKAVRRERAARLRELGQSRAAAWAAAQAGTRQRVLVERPGMGRAETFAEVRLPDDTQPGRILDVTIADNDGPVLVAG
jgi:threonylcarbamoyladenosine tRNA methylthiotransferase MtaB